MPEMNTTTIISIAVLAGVGGLLAWGLVVLWRRLYGSTWMVLRRISTERIEDVVIPDGVDGEIHLEHLLLTPKGLLVLELRNAAGALFAGERLDEWRVMDGGRRFTFRNPLPSLEARVRSVGLLAAGVPVIGRVAIVGNVRFAGGRPDHVTTLSELAYEFTMPADDRESEAGPGESSGGKPATETMADAWKRIVTIASPARH